MTGEVVEGRATPEAQRTAVRLDARSRVDAGKPCRFLELDLETSGIELSRLQLQQVTARAAIEAIWADRVAQVRDIALQRVPRRPRSGRSPDVVDQLLRRDPPIRSQEQVSEHQALPRAAERHHLGPVDDLQPSEDPKLHARTLCQSARRANPAATAMGRRRLHIFHRTADGAPA